MWAPPLAPTLDRDHVGAEGLQPPSACTLHPACALGVGRVGFGLCHRGDLGLGRALFSSFGHVSMLLDTRLDEAPPPVDEAPPPVDEAPPPVDEAPPPVDEAPPPVDEVPPPVDEVPPPVD